MFKQLMIRSLTGVIYLAVLYYSTKFCAYWAGIAIMLALAFELLFTFKRSHASWKTKLIIMFISLLYLMSVSWVLIGPLLFWFVCAASLVDISAYVTGRIIGGSKLCSSISPGKTIAGFIGGIVIPVPIALYVLYFYILRAWWENPVNYITITIQQVVLYLIMFAIFAQLGDLLVSYAKRKLCIKDSASWLPGHGGLWDRFDSVFGIVTCMNLIFFYTVSHWHNIPMYMYKYLTAIFRVF